MKTQIVVAVLVGVAVGWVLHTPKREPMPEPEISATIAEQGRTLPAPGNLETGVASSDDGVIRVDVRCGPRIKTSYFVVKSVTQ